jgi:HD-like signal output (HDOD) protein
MSITAPKTLSPSDLLKGDLQLASPPHIYFELLKAVDSPTKTLADAAFIIEKDAALSLRLLKIANSAYYGFPAKILSITRAISLIGTKELLNIVLFTVIVDRFSESPDGLISMHDFWARNLRCALIAQEIDNYIGKQHTDSVFICGILHNIGQLVFFRRIPELARQVELLFQDLEDPTMLDEVNIENKVIGFDRYQMGAELTRLWNLPEVISESIKLHCYVDNTESYYKIAAIVRLADCYSKLELNCTDPAINCFDIPIDDLSEIIEEAHEKFEEIFKVFF